MTKSHFQLGHGLNFRPGSFMSSLCSSTWRSGCGQPYPASGLSKLCPYDLSCVLEAIDVLLDDWQLAVHSQDSVKRPERSFSGRISAAHGRRGGSSSSKKSPKRPTKLQAGCGYGIWKQNKQTSNLMYLHVFASCERGPGWFWNTGLHAKVLGCVEESLNDFKVKLGQFVPVVPHKVVAEVSKIDNYRRGELLWCMDGRANPLMDRKVVGVVFF